MRLTVTARPWPTQKQALLFTIVLIFYLNIKDKNYAKATGEPLL
jgi:hypothetical protein